MRSRQKVFWATTADAAGTGTSQRGHWDGPKKMSIQSSGFSQETQITVRKELSSHSASLCQWKGALVNLQPHWSAEEWVTVISKYLADVSQTNLQINRQYWLQQELAFHLMTGNISGANWEENRKISAVQVTQDWQSTKYKEEQLGNTKQRSNQHRVWLRC